MLSVGCAAQQEPSEPEGPVGYTQPSLASDVAGVRAPVPEGDLEAIRQRGRLLATMQRMAGLALSHVEAEIGLPRGPVMPLVDVDPGATSGQVMWVHWPDPSSTPGDARLWASVSLSLQPERIMDVRMVDAPLSSHPVALARVHAARLSRAAVDDERAFASFPIRVWMPGSSQAEFRTYLFAGDGFGPDYEAVVVPGRRRLELSTIELVHARQEFELGSAGENSHDSNVIRVELPVPHPMTVSRVLRSGTPAKNVQIATSDGRIWSIATDTGAIERGAGS